MENIFQTEEFKIQSVKNEREIFVEGGNLLKY